jgi:hypothetical protein
LSIWQKFIEIKMLIINNRIYSFIGYEYAGSFNEVQVNLKKTKQEIFALNLAKIGTLFLTAKHV